VVVGLVVLLLVQVSCASPERVATSDSSDNLPATAEAAAEGRNTPVPKTEIDGDLVIHHGTIIDGSGAEPIANGLIVVEDGRITAVGAEGAFAIPEGIEVIDAQGGTILPGFIDAHTHALFKFFAREGSLAPEANTGDLTGSLQEGLTAFRDLGSRFGVDEDVAAMRVALDALGNGIPTVSFAGPILTVPNSPLKWCCARIMLEVVSVDQAGETTERLLAEGVDSIKLYLDDVDQSGNPAPNLSAEVIQAIVDTAHDQNATVGAHARSLSQAELAISNGVDELVHWPALAEALPDALIEQLVSHDIPVVSTFFTSSPLVRAEDVRRFLDAGGTLALGSDDSSWSPVFPWREIDAMLKLGLTPMEVIVSATANAARVSGLGESVGTLETGKYADIIVANGDVLTDLHVLEDLIAVIKGGEVVQVALGS
jgi:imidazolonepropionase-like amidohydrolase